MGINIKRESTQQLAREVARRTGESMTSAIEIALAERLDRLQQTDGEVSGRLASIRAIARDTARRWPDAASSGDLSAELYDDAGVPA
ncbi:MAG: type II toxin-antitoxin system VapB family antitoxin [Actinomycetota bacterium]|nr:type II toxin-antitoxin system VapB family antitoxin [Actinomycetota bacterium]